MKNAIRSLYLHFPYCRHLCNYCDFYKQKLHSANEIPQDFVNYLKKSLSIHLKLLNSYSFDLLPLKTFYIGGGTPSLLGPKGVAKLKEILEESNIKLLNNSECTIELNPGSINEHSLLEWEKMGINRFSIGIQSLNEKMLKVIDRIHSIEDSKKALSFFKKNEKNFSVDFLLGLPKLAKRDIIEELKIALDFRPKHLSLYILTVKENYLYYKDLPDEQELRDEYLRVCDFLKQNNYIHYEVSNFSIEGFESRHNQAYWRCESVAGLGPSATGLMASKSKFVRYKWSPLPVPRFEIENLNYEQIQLERLYMAFRMKNVSDLEKLIHPSEAKKLDSLFKAWKEKGHLLYDNDRPQLSSEGLLMLDSLLDDVFRDIKSL